MSATFEAGGMPTPTRQSHHHTYSLPQDGALYQPGVASTAGPGLGLQPEASGSQLIAPQRQFHQSSSHSRSLSDTAALSSGPQYLSSSFPGQSYPRFPSGLPPMQGQSPNPDSGQPIFQHAPEYSNSGYHHGRAADDMVQVRPYTHAGPSSQGSLPPLNYNNGGDQQIFQGHYEHASPQNSHFQPQNSLSPGQMSMSPSHPAGMQRSQFAGSTYGETPPTLHTSQFQSPSSLSSSMSASYGRPQGAYASGLPAPLPTQQAVMSSPNAIAVSAHGIVSVLSVDPAFGAQDASVTILVSVADHEPAHTIRGFKVLFGNFAATTRVRLVERLEEGMEKVEIIGVAPPLAAITKYPAAVPATVTLTLHALDARQATCDYAELGSFTYTDSAHIPYSNNFRSSVKRAGSPLSSSRDSPNSGSRPMFQDVAAQYPPETSARGHRRGHSRNSSLGSLVNGFGRLDHHSRNSSMTSINSEAGLSLGSASTSESLPGMSMPLPLSPPSAGEPIFVPGDKILIHTEHGPRLVDRTPIGRMRAQTVSNVVPTPSSGTLRHPPIAPAQPDTPTLYRTSQLPNAFPTDDGESSVPNAQRANLRFEGNLDYMAVGWSTEEWLAKRRLVQFWRRQEGQNIIASFREVGLQDLTDDSIVISCIFREEKNECFVTSVDTIYLLEALVAVRFTVEEKNRIRRNMEGFKPITISKAKQDAEAFFKLIMSFPAPKPRNIEKDVKVFPWKMLAVALRKIISKYSASYLAGEELGAPGKPVPQPIGWAPGRTPPPPAAAPLPSVNSNEDASAADAPTSRPMSGRSGSLGASRAPAASLTTVPEDTTPTLTQDPSATPTKA